MGPTTDCRKIRDGVKLRNAAADSKDMSLTRPEYIQTQLEEARFISSFTAAVCTSLELDDICSIAARAIYNHAPYYQIVFSFSEDLEGRTITISPRAHKERLAASPKLTVRKSSSLTAVQERSLAPVHINLLDNMGSIAIAFKTRQAKTFSESLLINIASYFTHAIRNAHEHNKMKELAMRDSLTKLFNRRTFDESLDKKAKCPDMHPVSLLLIDLDDFKKVNDTFGHQAGDHVLETVARILKESCRGHDLVARFGGEEFAIILSQAQASAAQIVAQRIKNRLAKTIFTFDERQIHVTVSIGLASCQEGSTIFTSNLLNRADRALYQAKRTGKNKVCAFQADLLTEVPVAWQGELRLVGSGKLLKAIPKHPGKLTIAVVNRFMMQNQEAVSGLANNN